METKKQAQVAEEEMNKETCDNCDRLSREAGAINFDLQEKDQEIARLLSMVESCGKQLNEDVKKIAVLEADRDRMRDGPAGTAQNTSRTQNKGRLGMSVRILGTRKYIPLNFTVPETRAVTIDFEASSPINLFILTPQNLQEFEKGKRTEFKKVELTSSWYEKFTFNLPPGSVWYLVPENITNDPVAIYYRVYNSK